MHDIFEWAWVKLDPPINVWQFVGNMLPASVGNILLTHWKWSIFADGSDHSLVFTFIVVNICQLAKLTLLLCYRFGIQCCIALGRQNKGVRSMHCMISLEGGGNSQDGLPLPQLHPPFYNPSFQWDAWPVPQSLSHMAKTGAQNYLRIISHIPLVT